MAFPTVPTIDYSYTAFQQAQGKNEFPGTQLDNDLAKLTEGLEDVRTFLERSFRSDGGILPGVLPTTGDLTAYGNDLADIYEATVAAKNEAVAAAEEAAAAVGGVVTPATTLAGYGITDAAPLSHVGAGGSAHALATTSVHGFLSSVDKAKIDGVASGATANASDEVLLSRTNHTGEQAIATVTGLQAALDAKVSTSSVGAASGVAPLGAAAKVPAAYLPSYVDDVVEADDFASLPATGETGKIYVTLDTNKTWRWSGTAYAEISASPGSTDAVPEGATNQYFTAARVRATVLTGLSTATNAVITAADTVLTAFGKIQAQITANLATLTDHTGNSANPHGVTKAQVGLSDVPNVDATARSVHTGTQTASTISDFAFAASSAAPVQSVSGQTGVVTLTKSDVGLGNVENTAPADMPISTAQAAALAGKVDSGGSLGPGATVPTPLTADDSTKVANTSWVRGVIAAISSGVTAWMGRSGNITAADVAADVNTAFGSTVFIAGGGMHLGSGNSLLFGDGDKPAVRSGAPGSDKYFIFDSDGNFRSLSGGLVAEGGDVTASGALYAGGGAKWTKAIRLADSTDFDAVTDAGFYDCGLAVNGPPGVSDYIYLEVQRFDYDATWCLQRATNFGTVGSDRALTWQRIRRSSTWGSWFPVSGFVTPQHYRAKGDGVADDTAPLGYALASGLPVLLDGLYRITSAVSVSMASRNGLIVYGTGSSSKIILDSTTAQVAVIDIDPDNPWGSNQDQVILRDFLVVPNVATTVDLLVISAVDGDMGSSSPGMDVSNVHVVPSSTSAGTTGRCFWFHNMRNGRVRGCSASGKYGLYAGTGMEFTAGAGGAPVEIDVTGCNVNHLDKGYSLTASQGSTANDDWQGVIFSACRAIAVNRGWNAITGSEEFSEWLTIEGCHAYFREIGIYAPNIRKPHFHHNYLTAHGSAFATAYGIDTKIGGGLAAYGSIDHNHVNWEAATGIATRVSYRVQTTGGSNSKTKVVENMSVLATAATDFGTGVIYRNNDTV